MKDSNEKPMNEKSFEGDTVENAIQIALDEMSVSRDEIKIKVVCEEKRGLFGLGGAKPAKIKVTKKQK